MDALIEDAYQNPAPMPTHDALCHFYEWPPDSSGGSQGGVRATIMGVLFSHLA